MIDPELKEIILQNQQTLESLDERVSKIQGKMRWQTIGNIIKTIFILGPVIVGIIYLSPYVKKYFKIFEPVLETLRLTPENSVITIPGTVNEGVQVNQDAILNNFCDPTVRQQYVEQLCK